MEFPEERQDKGLREALEADADAVLTWMLEGWTDYQARGGLAEPPAVKAATDAYHESSDAVARFITEACVVLPQVSATTGQLHTAYQAWAAQDGAPAMSLKAFGQALDRKGYHAIRTRQGAMRQGLGVAAPQEAAAGW